MSERSTTSSTTYLEALGGRAAPPSIQRLATIANELSEKLRSEIVFIGGAILPLLETDRTVLGSARATKDVDGVAGTTSYIKLHALEEALRARGFRHATDEGAHIGRWRSPSGAIFDLVSAGSHAGGNGSARDQYAVESAVTLDLPPVIRHVSGAAFLALKLNAYRDRGRESPRSSKDLSDIAALAATRPELLTEVSVAPDHVRGWIRDDVRDLLTDRAMESHVIAHVTDRDPLADGVAERVLEVLGELVNLS